MRDTSARARERAVTETFLSFPRRFCATGETNKLSLLDSREHKTRVTVFPRARARARMHRPARETLRLAVFDSERARVRSSRLLRASEREREPQEREKERASSRATSPKKCRKQHKTNVIVVVRKKKKEKKKTRWTEGGLYYDAKRKRALFVHGPCASFFFGNKRGFYLVRTQEGKGCVKISPFFFCLQRARL